MGSQGKTFNSSWPSKGLRNACSYHAVLFLQNRKGKLLLLHKEKVGLLDGLVLEVLEEWLRHSIT
jgi:hypothetical protein